MQKKKTAIITARMTPENKQKIEQRATNAGMTVTDYLTTCALGKKIVRVDGLDTILAELKAQGPEPQPAYRPSEHGACDRRPRR